MSLRVGPDISVWRTFFGNHIINEMISMLTLVIFWPGITWQWSFGITYFLFDSFMNRLVKLSVRRIKEKFINFWRWVTGSITIYIYNTSKKVLHPNGFFFWRSSFLFLLLKIREEYTWQEQKLLTYANELSKKYV